MALPVRVAFLASTPLLQAQSNMYILIQNVLQIKEASAKHFKSLVGVLSPDDLLVWRLETLTTPTVYGTVMYLSGHHQCCIPNYWNY